MAQQQLSEDSFRNLFDCNDEIKVWADYGGRGMGGRTCVGVVGGEGAKQHLISTVALNSITDGDPSDTDDVNIYDFMQELVDVAQSVRSDNMGREVIWYIQSLTPPENWKDILETIEG